MVCSQPSTEKPFVEPVGPLKFSLGFHEPNTLTLTVSEGSPDPHFEWFVQKINPLCPITRAECLPDPRKWKKVPRDWHVLPSIGTRTRKSTLFIPPEERDLHFMGTAENGVGTDDVSFSVFRDEGEKRTSCRVTQFRVVGSPIRLIQY